MYLGYWEWHFHFSKTMLPKSSKKRTQSSIWLFVSGEIQITNSSTIFSVPWMKTGTIDHPWNVFQGTDLKSIHVMRSLKSERCLIIEQIIFSCFSCSTRKATGCSSVCYVVCDSTVIIKLSTQYVSVIVSCVYYHWKDCNSFLSATDFSSIEDEAKRLRESRKHSRWLLFT